MSTAELKVELPSNLSEEEAKVLLAVKLYEVGKAELNGFYLGDALKQEALRLACE